jgi:hypothetical protein
MCCEPKMGHPFHSWHHFYGGCCMPHHTRPLSPKEEKEWLESYKRDLEDEIARVEERIKKIKE